MFTKPSADRPTIDTGPGLTKQSMARESNINIIMDKYQKTGMLNYVNNANPQYMDIEGIDFHDAMNVVNEASETFASLPSSVRKKFRNDPREFLDWVHDPANLDEMVELGLATRQVVAGPDGKLETADDQVKTTMVHDDKVTKTETP